MELPSFSHTHRIFTFSLDNLKLFKKRFIKKTMAKENFLKKPITAGIIGVVALLAGFYFLNNKITGNIVLSGKTNFSFISLIGLLLIACSAILILYFVKKR